MVLLPVMLADGARYPPLQAGIAMRAAHRIVFHDAVDRLDDRQVRPRKLLTSGLFVAA